MNEALSRLFDEREILAQLHNYCRAMDRCDRDLGKSVFHPDAVADYGAMFKGTGYAFVDSTIDAHYKLQNHLHRITNVSITVSGSVAGSEAYVDARLRGVINGSLLELYSCGRYIDRWEKRDGRWAISARTYLHEMDGRQLVEGAHYACAGRRDLSDLSYSVLACDAVS
jgi:hypothetical protein